MWSNNINNVSFEEKNDDNKSKYSEKLVIDNAAEEYSENSSPN